MSGVMKVFHIDQFKCTICSNWFCPPYNLPYLLPCTHSICTHCLESNRSNGSKKIVCPEDLEVCSLNELRINELTKKALERLMKEHNNFNQNTQLDCIKSLSINFDEIMSTNQRQIDSLSVLIDEVYGNQIKRIKSIWERTKAQLLRPTKIVNEWKQTVKNYLSKLKKTQGTYQGGSLGSLNSYIQQGRRIKMELYDIFSVDLHKVSEDIIKATHNCFQNNFVIFQHQKEEYQSLKNQKFQPRLSEQVSYPRVSLAKTIRIKQSSNQQHPNNTPIQNNFVTTNKSMNMNNLEINHTNNIEQNKNFKQNYIKESTSERFNELIRDSKEQNGIKKSETGLTPSSKNKTYVRTNEILERRNPQQDYYRNNTQNSDQNFIQLYQQPLSVKSPNRINPRTKINQINTETLLITQENAEKPNEKQRKPNIKKPIVSAFEMKTQNKQNIEDYASPGVIEEMYTQQGYDQQHDEMLLSGCNNWALGRMNFLKEWEINKNKNNTNEELEVRQKGYYDCQKEKVNYMKRMQLVRVEEALHETLSRDNYIQLIKYSLHEVDMALYLSHFDWNHIEIVKFVLTSLNDNQLNSLLNYILNSHVHTLVLTSNNLTDLSLDAVLHFLTVNNVLKNVYLQKNYVNLVKNKGKINLLREKGINIYI